ncbi:MAG: hypothetical protein ACKO7R_07375 [Pseudanabaena sp.]
MSIYESHIYLQIQVTSEALILAETYCYGDSPKRVEVHQVNRDLSTL